MDFPGMELALSRQPKGLAGLAGRALSFVAWNKQGDESLTWFPPRCSDGVGTAEAQVVKPKKGTCPQVIHSLLQESGSHGLFGGLFARQCLKTAQTVVWSAI
jgi:hypothetical protein